LEISPEGRFVVVGNEDHNEVLEGKSLKQIRKLGDEKDSFLNVFFRKTFFDVITVSKKIIKVW
jgi:hypothetical protein